MQRGLRYPRRWVSARIPDERRPRAVRCRADRFPRRCADPLDLAARCLCVESRDRLLHQCRLSMQATILARASSVYARNRARPSGAQRSSKSPGRSPPARTRAVGVGPLNRRTRADQDDRFVLRLLVSRVAPRDTGGAVRLVRSRCSECVRCIVGSYIFLLLCWHRVAAPRAKRRFPFG
jgi:hypothetical protein